MCTKNKEPQVVNEGEKRGAHFFLGANSLLVGLSAWGKIARTLSHLKFEPVFTRSAIFLLLVGRMHRKRKEGSLNASSCFYITKITKFVNQQVGICKGSAIIIFFGRLMR